MELLLRILATILHVLGIVLTPIISVIWGTQRIKVPPPSEPELTNVPVIELVCKIKERKLKSETLVRAYVERIRIVNPILNAIVENRCPEAIKDAQRVDQLIASTPPEQMDSLFQRYPLLGIPFTVKESCGVKDMSFVVGNIHRYLERSKDDGKVVGLLRDAGCIPLLVSMTPELCMSWETNNKTHGRCNNPYDTRKTPGGSSGGEGALNGCGASPFGVGSDIAGSIRLPALNNGIFGHKPTGGLLSNAGHFPLPENKYVNTYLQLGPITRFARDLPILLHIMSGDNSPRLELTKEIRTKDIKIYYLIDDAFDLTRSAIDKDFNISILKAVKHFENNGLKTKKVDLKIFENILEICFLSIFSIDIPNALVDPKKPNHSDNIYKELGKCLLGGSRYSIDPLCIRLINGINLMMFKNRISFWREEAEKLKAELTNLLGGDGVLFIPTFPSVALPHNTNLLYLPSLVYLVICNILGLPATHIPMGLNLDGLPIGFQVVASPFQDKLCLQIAGELEAAFGGWVHPK